MHVESALREERRNSVHHIKGKQNDKGEHCRNDLTFGKG